VRRCPAHQLGQAILRLPQAAAVGPFVFRALVFGHRQAHLLGKVVHGFHEAQAHVLGQEAQCITVGAAAEAVVGLPARADDETWRLLAVEGAQALEIDAGLAQLHMPAHHLGDVDARQQVLDEAGRNHAGQSIGARQVSLKHKRRQGRRCQG
jgi:hypothetical protein